MPVWKISTHTSRVGCDGILMYSSDRLPISTHTSRVGCDSSVGSYDGVTIISTHTSRVGCDIFRCLQSSSNCKFLLTHPVWDVTGATFSSVYDGTISTHTSRVGCDDLIPFQEPGSQPISTHTSRVGCDTNLL